MHFFIFKNIIQSSWPKTINTNRPGQRRLVLLVLAEDDYLMNSRPIDEQYAIRVQLSKFTKFVFFPEPKI